MAIHPKDRSANNPRLQCSVCGGWMRLHRLQPITSIGGYERTQNFYGGCPYSGGDHLAGKPEDNDVCDDCCHTECKRLAA